MYTVGALLELVDQFTQGHSQLSKPRYASGKCYNMSWQFIKSLEERGWSCVMQILEADGENAGREFQTCLPPRVFVNHYAVMLPSKVHDPAVIDFTARQFGAYMDFPWVATYNEWTTFMSEWLEENANSRRVRFNVENFYLNGGVSYRASYC